MLSKTRFQHGVRCPKYLWLDAHLRELARPPDAAARLRLGDGHRVGRIARARYPGGVLVTESSARHARAAARTSLLLEDRSVAAVFEGAFEYDGLRIRADVLLRAASGFDLVEVKSSLSPREEHVRDLAIQAFVLDAGGVELLATRLLHMNADYEWRGGAHDPGHMFVEVDLTDEVFAMIPEVRTRVATFRAILADAAPPEVSMGRQCVQPDRCPFMEHCGREAAGVGGERVEHAAALGDVHSPPRLLDPVSLLDVQWFSTSLPRVVGTRPHERVPFQWSLRTSSGDGRDEDRQCLAAVRGEDPRAELVSMLAAALPPRGSIVLFSHEEGEILGRLARGSDAASLRLRDALGRRAVYLSPLLESALPPAPFGQSWTWDGVLAAVLPPSARRAGSTPRQAAAAYVEALEPATSSARRRVLLESCLRYGAQRTAHLGLLLAAVSGRASIP